MRNAIIKKCDLFYVNIVFTQRRNFIDLIDQLSSTLHESEETNYQFFYMSLLLRCDKYLL